MQSNILLLLLVVIGAAVTQAHEFKYAEAELKGLCPKISYITNFEMHRILGWYYIPFTTLNSSLCLNNEGRTIYAAQFDDKTVNTDMCCRSAAEPEVAVCGSKIGTGAATATSNPGEFMYKFDNNVYPIYIIDTDYENYSVLYGCKPGSGRRSTLDELIIVFSRDYQLNDTFEARVRKVIKKNGGDWSKAKPSKQGDSTPYTPGPRPCSRDRAPCNRDRACS